MHFWVENMLKLYVVTAHEHVSLVLLRDSYQCHIMAYVDHSTNALGVEVHHIPGVHLCYHILMFKTEVCAHCANRKLDDY